MLFCIGLSKHYDAYNITLYVLKGQEGSSGKNFFHGFLNYAKFFKCGGVAYGKPDGFG
jgi:hypothetical protein